MSLIISVSSIMHDATIKRVREQLKLFGLISRITDGKVSQIIDETLRSGKSVLLSGELLPDMRNNFTNFLK